MSRDEDDIVSTLNDLIETCKDGEAGFRTASESVQSAHLKTIFSTYARQRAQFAAELQGEVRRLGEDVEKSGSAAGVLHRGWMTIRTAVSGRDDSAIISEAERGEDQAVKAYREALGSNLPPDIRTIVERQFQQVRDAHDRIRNLETRKAA